MLFSKSFIYTARQDPKTAECVSQKLLIKGCYLYMVSAGIYAYLPLGLKVLDNVSNIIRKQMNVFGAQELSMSVLSPTELWQKTGRDQDLKEIMLKTKDRKGRDLCLGPTHEEEITEICRKFLNSYKQLPFNLYQIQTKFRDEPRPRFGLVRGCEFLMKDAYSFDVDDRGLEISYQKMLKAYDNIFTECGLNFVRVEADSGVMGGKVSHEYMVESAIGEDVLMYCKACEKYFREEKNCPDCKAKAVEKKMIEVGHIFKLGTKYSQSLGATFLDKDGSRKPAVMGCYGIGVSRMLPVIIEQSNDSKGIVWPKTVCPFGLSLVVLEQTLMDEASQLHDIFEQQGLSVILDDRDALAGVKFNDAYLVGSPFIAVMGKNYLKTSKLELEVRKTGEKLALSKDELINYLKKEFSC